jgi:hypothetical protein
MYKFLTRLFFTLLLICLFLPFIPVGCGSSDIEPTLDSTAVETVAPTLDTLCNADSNITSDTLSKEKKDSISNQNSQSNKIFGFIISPDSKNLSGIGFIILYYNWVIFNSSLLVIVLTIITGLFLSVKNYNKWSGIIKKVALINLISWIMIGISMFKDVKIGIWIGSIISLINFILQILNNRKTKTSS